MSLNGLDDAKVTEAYTGALGEAGGWFLLKYASRDSVEILTRGTGGAAEARTAIAAYEEKSPLYGFLLYRRRKVLIKYVPESTSRLLQARVAVHFTAITDKFTPHDTTFSITTADELSDAALTSACSLHTAAPSSSSSSLSSRKQKLDEITEDVEDGQSTAGASESPSTARPSTANTVTGTAPSPIVRTNTNKETEEKSIAVDQKKPLEDTGTVAETARTTADDITDRLELIRTQTAPGPESFKRYDALFEHGLDPRLSSQTARPDLADLYAEIYAQYNKPKVKLGPRPKASLDLQRPNTSGSNVQSVARPVSSLPPGLRSSKRKIVEPRRPKSRDASTVPSIAVPPPPPIPTAPEIPLSPMYHPKSPTSIRSLPMNTYSSLHHKSAGATPEKQRLMKAMQLRKKQMEARKARQEKEAEAATEDTQAGAEEKAKDGDAVDAGALATTAVRAETSSTVPSTYADVLPQPRDEADTVEQPASGTDGIDEAVPREESKVEMTPTRPETDDIHSAASASSPTSAQTQGSSVAPSTRPSSISEDDVSPAEETKLETVTVAPIRTDETLLENEQTSAESTPTVVPETTTPIPHFEVSRPSIDATVPASEETNLDNPGDRKKKRETMILMSPGEIDEARARRKSKRASMMLPLSSESLYDMHSKALSNEEQPAAEDMETRRPPIDPTHLSAENSEADYLSDDSFMEELQSATVEEAMPMSVSVSKSPIMPFFPRKPSSPDVSVPKRSASQRNARLGGNSPEQPRKLSGPWLTHANTDTVVTTKKINVGSGISQRIKALAEKSKRDSNATLSPAITPEGGSSSVAQRKSSFFSTPPDGNSPNGKSANRVSRASFINVSRSTTPEPRPAVHTPRATTPTKHQTVYNMQPDLEKPESVQVTARIVRDTKPQKPALTMPTESSPLELHRSPITIDHQKSARPPTSSSRHSPVKTEPTSPRPPSSSQSNEPIPNLPRSSSESSWRSFGRRLSESKNGGPPRSMSAHSFDVSSSDEKPAKKEKKDSRASKLFKRMSSISSITRKNSAPNILEDIPSIPLPSLREPPSAVQLGDLNIQFPDTLVCTSSSADQRSGLTKCQLWKRRWVEVDASGNLVLSLSKANEVRILAIPYT
ncbi:uncharacterized protein N0V89_003411 [Didymosphaeria variabile]|uniref:ADF-H domain-containing protein n=1 Tax=Didymosphaeria variabile TaxID=1932322 RepID=A0A9W8XML0_9PLEO|nr:uncharacterized protein N0V89_003411 [Didymosphaeria variabile]KAJ4355395.1 hypothetical protein N0V89_003411 [Didymosphaeria variabile]